MAVHRGKTTRAFLLVPTYVLNERGFCGLWQSLPDRLYITVLLFLLFALRAASIAVEQTKYERVSAVSVLPSVMRYQERRQTLWITVAVHVGHASHCTMRLRKKHNLVTATLKRRIQKLLR